MAKITYKEFDKIMNLQKADVVPMYEHGIDYPIIAEIMGYKDSLDLSQKSGLKEFWRRWINFYDQMGYPYVSIEMGAKFPSTSMLVSEHRDLDDSVLRGWVDENDGVIKTIDDVWNKKLWLNIDEMFDYDFYKEVLDMVPDHMKAVGGVSGGPFEHATFLMGLTEFCIQSVEDPDMIRDLMEQITVRLVGMAEKLVKLDKLGVYRFGDDMGYTSATMISPQALREFVLPYQKRVVDVVHKSGKKFLLHSCGKLDAIMDDLIRDVGIDAKHSYEDKATPVTQAKKLWGDKIAIIGGIDVDFLCRASEEEITKRTIETMKECSKNGGYAIGSGNTITSYMPPKNYLAFIKAINSFNGI